MKELSIYELNTLSNRIGKGIYYNRSFLLCGFCEGLKVLHLRPKRLNLKPKGVKNE